jgi:hypothetical protein
MVSSWRSWQGETWSDERLDDLNIRMDKGFDEVKGEVKELRKEMNSRFDAMQRTLVLGLVGMTASIVASVIGGVFAALALS